MYRGASFATLADLDRVAFGPGISLEEVPVLFSCGLLLLLVTGNLIWLLDLFNPLAEEVAAAMAVALASARLPSTLRAE